MTNIAHVVCLFALVAVAMTPKKVRNIGRAMNIRRIARARAEHRLFHIGCAMNAITLGMCCKGDWRPCARGGCVSRPRHPGPCMGRDLHAEWYVDHGEAWHPDFLLNPKLPDEARR